MATPNISLAQFNKIATGDYNAGQIDFRTKDDGSTELIKVNNHVWKTSKNDVILSPERILEVKLAFLNALQRGGVTAEAIKEIRNRLGLPAEVDALQQGGAYGLPEDALRASHPRTGEVDPRRVRQRGQGVHG